MVSNKEWIKVNPEKVKLYRQRNYKKYREKILAKNKIYKQIHAEQGRAYVRAWNVAHKDKVHQGVRNRHNKLANLHDEYLAGQWCIFCGDNDIRHLDWHHRNPNEKETSITNMVHGNWSWKKIRQELKKCDCLCSNCHRNLHYDEKYNGDPYHLWGARGIKQKNMATAKIEEGR